MKRHLAVMNKSDIEAILLGEKTIEGRFSLKKITPFGQVCAGDLVFLKSHNGDIIGLFRVQKVFYFEGLTPQDVDKIFSDYALPKDRKNPRSFYGMIIFISRSERLITSPIKINKADRRSWIVLAS